MKRKIIVIWLVLGALFLPLACAPKATSLPEKAPTAMAPDQLLTKVPVKETWEKEWERLVKAAQKEGRVVIYTSEGSVPRAAIVTAFKNKYGIDVETVTGRSLELSEKLFSERRAGIYLVDAFWTGSTDMIVRLKHRGAIVPLEPEFLLPELRDSKLIEKTWFEGKLGFVDPETHSVLAFAAYVNVPFTINTQLVNPEEIKSYRDILQPKWKGKISLSDPTKSGPGGKWFGMMLWTKILDLDYMRQLAKQEPVVVTDYRLQAEWVARGKYPLAIAVQTGVYQEFVEAKAPVKRLPSPVEGDYITSGNGNITLIEKRPHPNAARLYLNWLLSQDGQTVYSVASGRQSRRLDVPVDHIDPAMRLTPGIKYYNGDDVEYLEQESERYKIAQEVFGR